MHFSARASVIRKNLVILVDVSSWQPYRIKVNGPYSMDNKISLSCFDRRYSKALPRVDSAVV